MLWIDGMKELLEEILSEQNLEKAMSAVVSNKGTSGVDRMSVFDLEEYLKDNKEMILNLVRKRKYKPLPVRRV